MGYWVYLARCGDSTIYTGATADLLRREREHNGEAGKGTGAKYTASHLPVTMAQAWAVDTWSDALRLEHALKRCSRRQKEQLIRQGELIAKIAEQRSLGFPIAEAAQELKVLHGGEPLG